MQRQWQAWCIEFQRLLEPAVCYDAAAAQEPGISSEDECPE